MSGVEQLVGVSVNCRWPGFGSTRREARPWSSRMPEIAAQIRKQKPAIILLQEAGNLALGGQALALVERCGDDYSMQAFGLNAVAWNARVFEREKGTTEEIELPDFGQGLPGWQKSGRTCITTKLRRSTTGARLKIGSFHLAVKGGTMTAAAAKSARLAQAKKLCASVNNDVDDWPLILAGDTNTRLTDVGRKSLDVFKDYGYRWPLQGSIDRFLANFGGAVDKVSSVDLGSATDHDLRVCKFHTERA